MQRPERLVLLGHPVTHSLSPLMHGAALRAARLPHRYTALDVRPAELQALAAELVAERAGGNVTIPHKIAFAALCDRRTAVAERTGAVNTFWVESGALVGDNTDVGGFAAAARQAVGTIPEGAIVALIGAGGGAAAVLAEVERWPACTVRVCSRTPARVAALCARFSAATSAKTLEDAVRGAHVVVNATPIGLTDDALPVPIALLGSATVVIDLVYRRGTTAWVHAARQQRLRAVDGLPMLVEQGALAFERWFGMAPDRDAMRAAVV